MKEALLSIIKDENRIITGQIDPQYLSDNLGRKKGTAEAVVFPVSTEEISGVMRYAWKNNLPVTPRGAGTNLVGSTVPSGHGIVLDVSLMSWMRKPSQPLLSRGLYWKIFRPMLKAKVYSIHRIRAKRKPPSAEISAPMQAVCVL